MPEQMLNDRLYPTSRRPRASRVFCFYPMSKRREATANWFTTPYEQRSEMMHEHGASGRKFAGRVVQLITGSTGLDDYEWGVTLFAVHPDDRQGRRLHDALRQGLGASTPSSAGSTSATSPTCPRRSSAPLASRGDRRHAPLAVVSGRRVEAEGHEHAAGQVAVAGDR